MKPLFAPIQWDKIALASRYYEGLGYRYIEVPWIVSEKVIRATLPPGHSPHRVEGKGCLVGSAEQSFIQMALDGEIAEGKYHTITPCFRDDQADHLHGEHFIKLELIHLGGGVRTFNIITDAIRFFKEYGECFVTPTDTGFDIEHCGVEIGSYGYRTYENVTWSFGTGIAEPRFSKVFGC